MLASGDTYITLTWLNSLGNWEYWTFSARHSYGINVSNSEDFDRDVFEDFDNEFISGQTITQNLSIESSNTIVLRSNTINKQQANAISQIARSLIVQIANIEGDAFPLQPGDFVTVQVDNNSLQYRTDREKIFIIEFNITLPKWFTQTA